MTETEIDITGLDPAEVLLALYQGTTELGLGFTQARTDVTVDDAREVLTYGSPDPGLSAPMRVDYMFGRPIKVSFGESGVIDLRLYDRDAGDGAGRRAIESLRARVAAR